MKCKQVTSNVIFLPLWQLCNNIYKLSRLLIVSLKIQCTFFFLLLWCSETLYVIPEYLTMTLIALRLHENSSFLNWQLPTCRITQIHPKVPSNHSYLFKMNCKEGIFQLLQYICSPSFLHPSLICKSGIQLPDFLLLGASVSRLPGIMSGRCDLQATVINYPPQIAIVKIYLMLWHGVVAHSPEQGTSWA